MNPFWTVSLFWIASVICVAIALAFVLPPLLRKRGAEAKAARRDINIAVYRDQMKEMEADLANGLLSTEQFQSAKLELEARLAEDALSQGALESAPTRSGGRVLGYSLAGVLPVAAFGLYFALGNPTSLIAIAEAQQAAPAMAGVPGEHDIAKLVQQVEAKVKANPGDGKGWAMLGKSYAVMERWPEAAKAYQEAAKLLPKEASVLTGYAEALAILNDRVLKGRPMDLVFQALELDPNDMKGLELAAINAFQDKNYAQAAYYFKHLLKLLPPESPYAQDIMAAQKEANRLARGAMSGMDNLADQGSGPAPDQAQAAGASISGSVTVAPALRAKLSGKETLFLFARSAQGGGPPLAAVRTQANKFPQDFELNDSMAMSPDHTLSKFQEVTLTARVSMSGNPMPGTGDLESKASLVKVGSKGVKIVIDTVRP